MKRVSTVGALAVLSLLLLSCGALREATTPEPTGAATDLPSPSVEPKATSTGVDVLGGRYGSIHEAARAGDVEAVRWYVGNGISVDGRDPEKDGTPLHIVAAVGQEDSPQWELLTRTLIDHGADVNARDSEGNMALQIAEANGDDEMVSFLRVHVGE